MFRDMRRKEKSIDLEETRKMLEFGEYGVLSTLGEDGYPYGIPVNYYYDGKDIYLHCAKSGQKLDNIKFSNKVSFSVVFKSEVVPEKFSTNYKSIVVFGKAFEANEDEKINSLLGFIKKYSPEFLEEGKKYIEKAAKNTYVIRVEIDHITGKGNKE